MIKIISSTNIKELYSLRRTLSPEQGLITKRSSEITKKVFGKSLKPIEVVRTIIADIKKNGDNAVLKYNKKLDNVNIPLNALKVSKQEISKAYKKVDMKFIQAIKKAYNPQLKLVGILLTMYDENCGISCRIVQSARKHLGSRLFDTIIPRDVRIAESTTLKKPLVVVDVNSAGAKNYLKLAQEVMDRMKKTT